MKKLHLIPVGILLFSLTACYDESHLVTNPVSTSIHPVTFSRSIQTSESLSEGATVLFNAQGRLNADNHISTYTNGQWTFQGTLQWENGSVSTTYTALYPVYEDLSYSSENLYTDEGLEDILIARDTLANQENINLEFKHLFSLLNFQVSESINETIESLRLTVPYTVSALSKDGTVTLAEIPHTTIQSSNADGSYSFILPPMEDVQLTLDIITAEGSHTHTLSTHTFESHMKYECKLRNNIGILTVEDLIAFSQLINDIPYEGKTLDDFGEKKGEDSIFYLLADLELTEEDCNRLQTIGYLKELSFDHIFEGNNHTISNLTIPDQSTHSSMGSLYSGLFGYIGENGTIRNLHLSNATTVQSPTCQQPSILASQNHGQIIHCSVKDSKMYSGSNNDSQGIICSNNKGYVVNCSVENCNIKVAESCKCGIIAGNAVGYILNCYAYNNTFTTTTSSYTGGIAGMSNINQPSVISNCCVYHTKTYSSFGAIIGNARAVTISNIFYNIGNVYYDSKSSTTTNCYKYDSNYLVDDTHLSSYLNDWIESTGATSYPDLEFKKWSTDTTALPTFQ